MSEKTSTPLALDESLYNFAEDERTFLKQQTGILDDDELKAHVVRVQAEAYEVCIRELFETFVIAAWRRNSSTEFISRFILTLASVSSLSQSESLKKNEYAEMVVIDITPQFPQVQDGSISSVSTLISELARDRQNPQGSGIFRHRQL
jgi:hypothetical protein